MILSPAADCLNRDKQRGDRRQRKLVGLWGGVVCPAHGSEELVTLVCPRFIFTHHLLKERRDVISASIPGIPDVLAIIVPTLKCVVLNRNQIKGNVVKSCLSRSHRRLPFPNVTCLSAPL